MVKMVKAVKKTFLKVLGDMRLTLNEIFTMLTEITMKPTYISGMDYISLNLLMLGRSSEKWQLDHFKLNRLLQIMSRLLIQDIC